MAPLHLAFAAYVLVVIPAAVCAFEVRRVDAGRWLFGREG